MRAARDVTAPVCQLAGATDDLSRTKLARYRRRRRRPRVIIVAFFFRISFSFSFSQYSVNTTGNSVDDAVDKQPVRRRAYTSLNTEQFLRTQCTFYAYTFVLPLRTRSAVYSIHMPNIKSRFFQSRQNFLWVFFSIETVVVAVIIVYVDLVYVLNIFVRHFKRCVLSHSI